MDDDGLKMMAQLHATTQLANYAGISFKEAGEKIRQLGDAFQEVEMNLGLRQLRQISLDMGVDPSEDVTWIHRDDDDKPRPLTYFPPFHWAISQRAREHRQALTIMVAHREHNHIYVYRRGEYKHGRILTQFELGSLTSLQKKIQDAERCVQEGSTYMG